MFFIPDPWTQTSITAGNLLTKLFTVLRKQVNQNAAGKTGLDSVPVLLMGLLKYVPVKRWPTYISNILGRKKPGYRAILLDRLLSDIFIKEWNSNKPDFANLFLNSGAHIQHHYLFNSGAYDGDLKIQAGIANQITTPSSQFCRSTMKLFPEYLQKVMLI